MLKAVTFLKLINLYSDSLSNSLPLDDLNSQIFKTVIKHLNYKIMKGKISILILMLASCGIVNGQRVTLGNNTGYAGNMAVYVGNGAGLEIEAIQGSVSLDGNTFVGDHAGSYGNSPYFGFNTFIGHNAGRSMSGPVLWNNVLIGKNAGYNSTMAGSVALGLNAGNNSDAEDCVFLGAFAGINSIGIRNSFWGDNSGSNSNGDRNTFLGYSSGSRLTGSGNICLGSASGQRLNGDNNIVIGSNAKLPETEVNDKLWVEASNSSTPLIFGDFIGDKVGINTTNLINTIGGQDISNYTLYVEGGMLADQVRVRTEWADYVFKQEYDLKSISELEDFISQNGHLPNCPTENEVLEAGIEIGSITKIQQEKIEELTLYIIEQDRQFKDLRKEFDELKELLLTKGN